jgi:4,5-dihydroxyphthalate decarboxylase
MTVQLSLAVCDYDRTRAIFDGRAEIEGCDVTAVALEPEESFHRAFKFNEFDISEISMSSYMMTTARGEAHYVAIPAFVSRLFRHSGIYIRTDRGIKGPHDLKAGRSDCPNTR